MTKNPSTSSCAELQIIEVYSQINLGEYRSVKAFIFQLIRDVFHSQVPAGCKRQIESTSYILVGSDETFQLSLQLNNKRIEFSSKQKVSLDKPVVFVPHKDSNAKVPHLCELLNEFSKLLEISNRHVQSKST